MLSFLVFCFLVSHQCSALDLLRGLQHSAEPMLIFSCLWRKKRPSAFYKLNLEHKNGVMTECLEKPLLGNLKFSPSPGGSQPNGGFKIFHTFFWEGGGSRVFSTGEMGGDSTSLTKYYSSIPLGKVPPVDSPLTNLYSSHQRFIPSPNPLNDNFHVKSNKKIFLSCIH